MTTAPTMTTSAETAVTTEPQKEGPKLGIFDDIPNEEYHRGPGISKSGLDLIRQSPAEYITRKRHPKPPTPAMMLGTALHGLILEPETFEAQFVADKYAGSQTKEAKAWREQMFADGINVVHTAKDPGFWDRDDWRAIHAMRDAVYAHPIASILLDHDQGIAERSVYWIDHETRKLCKCRPDFHNQAHNLIVDLKSTEDASYSGFGQSVAKWRYHVQDAFYRDGMHAIGETVAGFVFVAVEKNPPYGVAVYRLGVEEVRVGRLQYQSDLMRYKQCHDTDTWPSYPEDIRDLTLSQYQLRGFIS